MKRTHIIDIRFEDGKTSTITVQDRPDGQTLHIEGLDHIVKASMESYTIRPFSIDKRAR